MTRCCDEQDGDHHGTPLGGNPYASIWLCEDCGVRLQGNGPDAEGREMWEPLPREAWERVPAWR